MNLSEDSLRRIVSLCAAFSEKDSGNADDFKKEADFYYGILQSKNRQKDCIPLSNFVSDKKILSILKTNGIETLEDYLNTNEYELISITDLGPKRVAILLKDTLRIAKVLSLQKEVNGLLDKHCTGVHPKLPEVGFPETPEQQAKHVTESMVRRITRGDYPPD